MTRLFRHLTTGAFALFVLGGLTFGASQTFGSSMDPPCGFYAEEMGTCPPFDNASCDQECEANNYLFGGFCIPHPEGGKCCVCLV